jgi:hypothetical protein
MGPFRLDAVIGTVTFFRLGSWRYWRLLVQIVIMKSGSFFKAHIIKLRL